MSASNELSTFAHKNLVKTQTSGALQARILKHKQKQLVFLLSLAQTFDVELAAKEADTSASLVTYKWMKKKDFREEFEKVMNSREHDLSLINCACGLKFKNYRALSKHGRDCPKFTVPEEKIENDEAYAANSLSRFLNSEGNFECVCGKEYARASYRKFHGHLVYCVDFAGKDLVKSRRDKLQNSEARRKMSIYASTRDMPSNYHAKWYRVANLTGEVFSLQGTWEREVALKFNELGVHWTRGRMLPYDGHRHYTPDFQLDEKTFVEVKGWWRDTDIVKMRKVSLEHPEIVVLVIDSNNYTDFLKSEEYLLPTVLELLNDL